MARMHIVATTVQIPRFLDSYRVNLDRFGHLADVKMWVVGDRKSPREAAEFADHQRALGLDTEYLGPSVQESWLARYEDVAAVIPWNSDNRRNVGFLRALEEGCEILVSIDDDNYCLPESDFYEGHLWTGTAANRELISSGNGWFNICSELVLEPNVQVVPRGFPHAMRDGTARSLGVKPVSIVANAGLWLGDPDVDAATRLAFPVRAMDARNRSIALAPGVWSPINTQNTSIARRAVPAYYYVRMLEDFPGARLDRYGDIWSGFFLSACAEHLQETITVGLPVVSHQRNSHDLLVDLRAEFWGMMVTPRLVEMLRGAELRGDDYAAATKSLARLLQEHGVELEERANVAGLAGYLERISSCLNIWVDVCNSLMPAS